MCLMCLSSCHGLVVSFLYVVPPAGLRTILRVRSKGKYGSPYMIATVSIATSPRAVMSAS